MIEIILVGIVLAMIIALILFGTTQAAMATMITPAGDLALDFLVTATDDAWTELVDRVNSLSLYKVMQGAVIDRYIGSYALGCGCIRIINLSTNKVKMIELLDKAGSEQIHPLTFPVKVEYNDVLQVRVTAENS